MKKKSKPKGPRHLDKLLFEAGQQCLKRLWLDYHEPVAEPVTALRQEMSRAGDELRGLARQAFPKGVTIEAKDAADAAAETRKRLDEGVPVLFDAAFVAEGVEVRCDILVVHKNQQIDLFEVKSGTKVKHRYVNDLALQATVLAHSGLTLRAAFLLHVNPQYAHKEGEPYPPMQLLRSADVTAKVQKQLENVQRRLGQFRQALDNEALLALPMGTYCTVPFPCPHLARCSKEAPPLPLRELPELTRKLELELHKEGVDDLSALDPDRPGLTFRQRRTLACVKSGERIVEPFVASELRQCGKLLHFVAMLAMTEPLPRFDRQHPWQLTPYAWAACTVHPDGRVESRGHVHVERSDPRPGFVQTLAKQLEVGGTVLVWGDEMLREIRALLDSVPGEKAAVRALLGLQHLDMMQLFEAGVFDPRLRSWTDLRAAVATLLGDRSGDDMELLDDEARVQALLRAQAPRVRSTTRDKVAGEIRAALAWQAERLLDLFRMFANVEAPAEPPTAKKKAARPRAAKPLPKLPE